MPTGQGRTERRGGSVPECASPNNASSRFACGSRLPDERSNASASYRLKP